MAYKIEIDKEKCIGCGACVAVCPKYFEMKGSVSVPKESSVEELACAQEAADNCPATCIKVTKA